MVAWENRKPANAAANKPLTQAAKQGQASELAFQDGFREVREIGRGAQGSCHLVEHLATGGKMVLKRLYGKQTGNQGQLHEFEVLCKLAHPNITRLYGAWRSDDSLSILMEFADGGSLAEAMQARKATAELLAEEAVLDWFVQIVLALSYMHTHSIMHRDLKAANVFLTKGGVVKVGDLGIAKVLEKDDLAHTAVGTPYYLAPELINGEAYGLKADVWALGVLLYEMMALHRPFEADSLPCLAMKILRANHAPPPPSYSAELRGLLGRLLQRDPTARPSLAEIVSSPFFKAHHARLHSKLPLGAARRSLSVPATPPAERPAAAAEAATAGVAAEADAAKDAAAAGAAVEAEEEEARAVRRSLRTPSSPLGAARERCRKESGSRAGAAPSSPAASTPVPSTAGPSQLGEAGEVSPACTAAPRLVRALEAGGSPPRAIEENREFAHSVVRHGGAGPDGAASRTALPGRARCREFPRGCRRRESTRR